MTQLTTQQTFELAIQHHQAGRLHEAEQLYRQILTQEPKHIHAMHHLGMLAHQAGRNDIAVDLLRRVLTLAPNWPEAHYNFGIALNDVGQLDEAIVAYRQAIMLRPNYAEAHNNLGNALKDKGQLDQAIAACRQAIMLRPNYATAYCNLGIALANKGQLDQAITTFRQAIELKPNFVQAHYNLGNALKDKGQLDEAVAAYRQAIALNPDNVEVHNNLGNVLKDKGQLDQAVAAYRQAIALKPDNVEAHSNLGNALKDKGQFDEAIAAYRTTLALKPNYVFTYCNLLYCLHFHPGYDAGAIYEEHIRWDRLYAAPLKQFIQQHANDRDPDRRLKIGYISPDFREHSVSYFIENLLASHDPDQVEIFCYAELANPDQVSRRLESNYIKLGHWRRITGCSDQQIADMIRNDGIDILVDLAGHTGGNRLLVLARKPAPVQVTWLGYLNTTGLSVMDYRFTDAYADPPGASEEFYTEQLVRLAPTFLCYRPPEAAPPCAPTPASDTRYITFGCFNALAKINRDVVDCWAQIMRQHPESKLQVKNRGLSDADARRRLQEEFAARGIDPKRLDLRGHIPSTIEHLQRYSQIDIALDTFPYNGTTTTCEALWMGVPVVTLAGQMHMSRVGVSLLSNVGLLELIAQTPQKYVEIVVQLAGDLPKLRELRLTLRRQMEQSPLMDAPRFARNVEAAYRDMWRKWCGGGEKIES